MRTFALIALLLAAGCDDDVPATDMAQQDLSVPRDMTMQQPDMTQVPTDGGAGDM